MKRGRFRKEAEAELHAIVAWYEDVAPEAVGRILNDIHRSIDQIIRFPDPGCRCQAGPFGALSR